MKSLKSPNTLFRSVATALACAALLSLSPLTHAANVTLTGIDGIGTSSFNTAGLWSDAAAPSAGNDYFVPNGTRLRTPADGNSHTFAGDSLTINNTTPYGDGFMFKGTGSAGAITVNNLILDGGLISHANGGGDYFNLYGNINVVSDSRLYPKQGPIYIYSAISGSAALNILASDNSSTFKIWLQSSANTFTGNIVNNGRLELADNANLNFVIGASGVNNNISNGSLGTQQHSIFDGDFVLDLSGAGTTAGDMWSLVTTVPASTYYTSTFTVAGATYLGSGYWDSAANGGHYIFNQANGSLEFALAVPEPSLGALLGLGVLGVISRFRRKA